MSNLTVGKLIYFLMSSLVSISAMSAEVVLLQTGKSFVQGIDEEKAKAIADNRDEVKKYSLEELKVKVGDIVNFKNVDSVKHNVVAEDMFNFVQPFGSSDKYKFEKKGSYTVRCAIHPKMKIKVQVD